MRRGKASSTAKLVAFDRALADTGWTSVPGFRDPFARALLQGWLWQRALDILSARAQKLPDDPGLRRARSHLDGLILRVSFLDALVTELVEPSASRGSGNNDGASPPQVVILGAGLDTRAWRLPALRGVRVFEVDHPATQAYKRSSAERLPPPLAELTFVPVDFARDGLESALLSAGHTPETPTIWIWEGVIMYLGDDALRGTLARIEHMSCPTSTLLAHYHEPDPASEPTRSVIFRRWLLRLVGEPQIGTRTRDVMRVELERCGFRVVQDADQDAQAQRVGGVAPDIEISRVSRIAVAELTRS